MQNAHIEKWIAEKLLPSIKPQLQAVREIQHSRRKLADEISLFQRKVESGLVAVREIQDIVDRQIIDGADTRKGLRELEVKKADLQASERRLEALAIRDCETERAARSAQKELSEALTRNIMTLRGEVESQTRELLNETLGILVHFEESVNALCRENSVTLSNELAISFPRFLSLDGLLKHLGAYLSPAGGQESYILRKKLRAEFLAA